MKTGIHFDFGRSGITSHTLLLMQSEVEAAHNHLHQGTGQGNEFTGWVDFPLKINRGFLEEIGSVASDVREHADIFIVVGIGGSYLGARSAIEFLHSPFYNRISNDRKSGPEIYYFGNNVSPIYMEKFLSILEGKSVYINVVSKSGTTLEPALAFRMLRKMIEDTYGKEEAKKRIIVTTDQEKGVLKEIANQEGYRTFQVPNDIGGRYSVLSAVGLLPIAVSGADIFEIIQGAADACHAYKNPDIPQNPCYQYAALRNILYKEQKTIELLVNYEPSLTSFSEWWKQLFGESEGKGHKGIFPGSVHFSTDLHSIGQYIQDGLRNIFTTTIWVEDSQTLLTVPPFPGHLDHLDYLEGTSIQEINEKVCQGAMEAHFSGGVPNLKITIPSLTPYVYGQLVYFFLKACAISGYLLGVNPFDQPGVEEYKRNMYKLLQNRKTGV